MFNKKTEEPKVKVTNLVSAKAEMVVNISNGTVDIALTRFGKGGENPTYQVWLYKGMANSMLIDFKSYEQFEDFMTALRSVSEKLLETP